MNLRYGTQKSTISEPSRTDEMLILQSLIAKSSIADFFKLSWTHYLFLMGIEDPNERSFYEIEAAAQHWTVGEGLSFNIEE